MLFGWLIFGETPFDRLFPGVLLIVGAGLLIVWREQVRRNPIRRAKKGLSGAKAYFNQTNPLRSRWLKA